MADAANQPRTRACLVECLIAQHTNGYNSSALYRSASERLGATIFRAERATGKCPSAYSRFHRLLHLQRAPNEPLLLVHMLSRRLIERTRDRWAGVVGRGEVGVAVGGWRI